MRKQPTKYESQTHEHAYARAHTHTHRVDFQVTFISKHYKCARRNQIPEKCILKKKQEGFN